VSNAQFAALYAACAVLCALADAPLVGVFFGVIACVFLAVEAWS